MANPNFAIYCSALRNGDLGSLQKETRAASGKAKERGYKEFAVLFSETALMYSFNIKRTEVGEAAEKIRQMLPRYCVVAFSACELGGKGSPYSTGYLVNSKKVRSMPQMCFTPFVKKRLEQAFGNDAATMETLEKNWSQVSETISALRLAASYQHVDLPSGLIVEGAVCRDVIIPAWMNNRAITLVSAHELDPGEALPLAGNRKGVVIHDSNEEKPLILPTAFAQKTVMEKEGDFWRIEVLAEPFIAPAGMQQA